MKLDKTFAWRALFVFSALFIIIGGPQHPRGTMSEMLADPKWVPSHLFILAGFLCLLLGLLLYRQVANSYPSTSRWFRYAIFGTILQAIEMAVHTAAVVDYNNLISGRSTPVLTTHLVMAIILYPVFAFTVSGFIVATAKEKSLSSRWISWIGILGLIAHGAAPPLVVGLQIEGARVLFPFILLFAIWLGLSGFWPARTSKLVSVSSAK